MYVLIEDRKYGIAVNPFGKCVLSIGRTLVFVVLDFSGQIDYVS